jgi:predicted DNA-binding transcriptional regulator AlpA
VSTRAKQLEELLSIPAAYRTLGISQASLYRLFDRGELPVVHVGGRRMIDPKDLRRYIARQKVQRVRLPENDDDPPGSGSSVRTIPADAGDGRGER